MSANNQLPPSEVLFGNTRRAVLALLFTHPDQAFYLRQIARAAHASVGAGQRELRKLTALLAPRVKAWIEARHPQLKI